MPQRNEPADANARPLPPGYRLVPVRTTYLEMRERPSSPPVTAPAACEVRRWESPGTGEYRKLYGAVGGAWGWSGRLILEEEELQRILEAKTSEIYLLYSKCKVAGFAELDRRAGGEVEIAYFGLLPAFIGRGLGKFFLDWAVRRAWEGKTERLWLHTCRYDHPGAMAVYLKAGFSVRDERIEMQPYAEEFLGNFPGAGG